MRLRLVLPLIAAAGALALTACDSRTPKPDFAKEAAPAPVPAAAPPAPEAPVMAPVAEKKDCCCCACQPKACPEPAARPAKAVKAAKPRPVRKAVARPAVKPAPAIRRTEIVQQPLPPAVVREPPPPAYAGHERTYRRYQGPDIETRGFEQHRYAESYGRQAPRQHYEHHEQRYDRYAYAPPPPPPAPPPVQRYGHAYGYAERGTYSEQRSYSGGHAYGVASGPCCAPRPLPAAGRDAVGYLTWPGKSGPAPY